MVGCFFPALCRVWPQVGFGQASVRKSMDGGSGECIYGRGGRVLRGSILSPSCRVGQEGLKSHFPFRYSVLCNRLTKNTKLICDIKFIAFADSDLPLYQWPRLVTTNPQRTSDR